MFSYLFNDSIVVNFLILITSYPICIMRLKKRIFYSLSNYWSSLNLINLSIKQTNIVR